ncbi:hypothetical protein HCB69_16005 [Listeria booriae]|uniref:Uncharacterized protein n=1 Tax=Listeria booriae TaxID=1552123 RepID=A0A842FZB5_9LIST|nr:hypothetical protein [Listeria booriae]MBC2285880.1 hypothetical protein [Listeria booriae]
MDSGIIQKLVAQVNNQSNFLENFLSDTTKLDNADISELLHAFESNERTMQRMNAKLMQIDAISQVEQKTPDISFCAGYNSAMVIIQCVLNDVAQDATTESRNVNEYN